MEKPNIKNVLRGIEEHYDRIMASIVDEYGLSVEAAEELYFDLWVFSHGVAVMTVTNVCKFDSAQINHMLTRVFTALFGKFKSEK